MIGICLCLILPTSAPKVLHELLDLADFVAKILSLKKPTDQNSVSNIMNSSVKYSDTND